MKVFEASKWLQSPLLVDVEEMASLIEAVGDFEIYVTSALTSPGEGKVSHQAFLDSYKDYINAIKEGIPPEPPKTHFSSVWTADPQAVVALPINESEQIIRVKNPVIQLRIHSISYSPIDKKFRSMVLGDKSIAWGVVFAYPQLWRNPATQMVEKVGQTPNTTLFRTLQQWVRRNTVPTPFLVSGEKTNVPVRLGKNCFDWIDRHPQLIEQGIFVEGALPCR